MTKLPQDDKLNELLMHRAIPVERDDFAARIISASRDVPQHKNITFTVWLRRIFTEFSLPTPAYAISSVLVIGILIGFGLQDFGAFDLNDSDNSADTMFIED